MNAALAPAGAAAGIGVLDTAAAPARVALLGTGTVGRAVLERLAAWQGTARGARLSLVHVANSRVAVSDAHGLCPRVALSLLRDVPRPLVRAGTQCGVSGSDAAAAGPAHADLGGASDLDRVAVELRGAGVRIVIDATASDAVAGLHAHWLAHGIHVVTASKLGQGASLARWWAIRGACTQARAQYGDSATVGAGLPLLRTLRELQAGGDRVHAIAGVLSGSLAWLFDRYDGLRPFSGFVREARAAGFTEPDPRDDLSGEDVRRKLLILARSAGVALEAEAVDVDSLVPPALAAVPAAELDGALAQLDGPLRARFAAAYKDGAKLRFIARLDAAGPRPRARVGLEALSGGDPLAVGAGTDNRVAIWSDRYCEQPLVIQGPGAGAGVTAAALLDDALRIAGMR